MFFVLQFVFTFISLHFYFLISLLVKRFLFTSFFSPITIGNLTKIDTNIIFLSYIVCVCVCVCVCVASVRVCY